MSPAAEGGGRAVDALARFVARLGPADIPPTVLARAGDCLLDVLGAAVAGRDAGSSRAMAGVMAAQFPPGPARLWFTDAPARSPIAAATANAMAATALDIDDGHRKAAGHPGAAVVAAACAAAEAADARMDELMAAIVAGYEAAIAVALARRPTHHSSTVSGRWSGVGAAVAAARLMRLPPPAMAEAILIAEQHAPRVAAAMHHGFAGSDVKEGIAWSVHSGMFAAELAAAGFRGYPQAFDQGILYDPARLVDGLGRFDALAGLFFKPYACCRWSHSAIDALAGLLSETGVQAEAIEAIEVETFARATGLGNHPAPASEAEAQFSIPFCLGVVAVAGAAALTPMDARLIGNGRVEAVARRVRVSTSPDMDALFPGLAPARVRLRSGGQTFLRTVEAAFGDPTNPMGRDDLRSKFRTLAAPHLDADRIGAIVALCAQPGDPAVSVRAALAPLAGGRGSTLPG